MSSTLDLHKKPDATRDLAGLRIAVWQGKHSWSAWIVSSVDGQRGAPVSIPQIAPSQAFGAEDALQAAAKSLWPTRERNEARTCWAAMDACNPVAVAGAMHRFMRICYAHGLDTPTTARHPITVCYLDKLCQLALIPADAPQSAYAQTHALCDE